MSAGARRGATPAAVRVLQSGTVGHVRTETATCQLCKGELQFTIGEFGQTFERCATTRCPNAVPHHPEPDRLAPPARRRTPKSRRGPRE